MPGPQPCSLGSLETFSTAEAREEANQTWQRWEWKIRAAMRELGLGPAARLAMRLMTGKKDPKEVREPIRVFQ